MKKWAYYNEIDDYCARWLKNLMKAKLIPQGEIDTRSIEDVLPSDIKEFNQHHWFAGIGGWAYALRKAGWRDSESIWTGSCPCQPFSVAGEGEGLADKRHLWPAWFHHIAVARPERILGEQVANSNVWPWLELLQNDLETLDYITGAVVLPACSVGAPNIRARLWWMGHTRSTGLQGGSYASVPRERWWKKRGSTTGSSVVSTFWDNAEWWVCGDGKARPVEPGTQPLAYGVPEGMGRLRAYGNAINVEAAVKFIEAAKGCFYAHT